MQKFRNIFEANKIIKKAKESESFIKYGHIGHFEDLKIMTHTDASHCTVDRNYFKV